MSYQADLVTHLGNDATITDIVSTRIFADVADGSAATPFIVYSVTGTGGETLHDGSREIEFPRVQISCFADTKVAAVNLCTAIRASIEGVILSGSSEVQFVFDDQHGTREPETNLFAEIIEFRGVCNTNQ